MLLPFTKDDVINGILTDHTLWRGTVKELPKPKEFIVMVALTNNQYDHPLLGNRHNHAVEVFDIGLGVYALVLQRNLLVFPPKERRSRSKDSRALYLYKTNHDHHCTLVQVLPPFRVTSCHNHWWTTEDFSNFVGTCRIGTLDQRNDAGMQYTTLAQSKLVVPPYVTHQMANETEKFAVNFLIMQRSDRPFSDATDMDDHHYVEPSPFKFSLSI